MSSIREVRDAFEKIIKQMQTEKIQLRDSINEVSTQISNKNKELRKISLKLWAECSRGNDAELTATKLRELLGIYAEIWISKLKETMESSEEAVSSYNIDEIKEKIDELEGSILSVKEEARNVMDNIKDNKPTPREDMIYADAKSLMESLLVGKDEFDKAENYGLLGTIFSKRKRTVKEAVCEFKALTEKAPEDIIKEYEDQEAKTSKLQSELEEIQTRYDTLESEINHQISLSNKYNEHTAIIDTLSKIINNDTLLKDYLFEKFEKEKINDTVLQTYFNATGDATIPNEYNESLAKIEVLKKMLETLEKDYSQANKIERDLNSKMSKIRRAASRSGYKSTRIDADKIIKDITKMRQANSIKRNWCNNSIFHINNTQTRNSTDLLTWPVLYNLVIADVAASTDFEQSGALLMFSDEINGFSEVDGLDFDLHSIDTSDLALIGGELDNLDIDSVTRNLDSFTNDISNQVDSISNDVSTITTDTSSSMSFGSDSF